MASKEKPNKSANERVEAQPVAGKLIGVVNCKIVESVMEREQLGRFENRSEIVAIPNVFEKHSKLMALGVRLSKKD